MRPPGAVKLYVTPVTDNVPPEDVKTIFEKHGPVVECEMGKNYAYVYYNTDAEAQEAIKHLSGFMLDGKPLRVEIAREAKGRFPARRPYGREKDWDRDRERDLSETLTRDDREQGGGGGGYQRGRNRNDAGRRDGPAWWRGSFRRSFPPRGGDDDRNMDYQRGPRGPSEFGRGGDGYYLNNPGNNMDSWQTRRGSSDMGGMNGRLPPADHCGPLGAPLSDSALPPLLPQPSGPLIPAGANEIGIGGSGHVFALPEEEFVKLRDPFYRPPPEFYFGHSAYAWRKY